MSKNKIERISRDVAERLTTAQVVVSISSALRQLIDNSIDAGATIIDIRVKQNGFESIEVQDNGSGIEIQNFDALCKPHSTSKLTTFSDFDKLATLGFRGEALNALCTVSSVSIFTRSSDWDLGTRLSFDHSGNITQKTSSAREKGTTIVVDRLFETLPVRRKELERNQKKEFLKLLATVQQFAILCPHIKILCTNSIGGKKNNMICTAGGNSKIQDVVMNLFGISGKNRLNSNDLCEVSQRIPDLETMAIYSVPADEMQFFDFFKIRGFVSSCEHGCGRGTSDRQFVYINNRPVEYSRVCSVVNEVYKMFNKNQYPIIVLFIDVPPGKIDVNVTPDKKTVMLEKERHLLAVLRSSMLKTFQKIVGSHSTIKSSVEDRRISTLSQNDDFNSSFASSNPQSPLPDDTFTVDDDGTLNSTVPDDSLMNMSDLLRKRRENRSPPAKIFKEYKSKAPPTSYNSGIRRLDQYSFTMEPKKVEIPKIVKKSTEKSITITEEELRSAVVENETDGDVEILNFSQDSQNSQSQFDDSHVMDSQENLENSQNFENFEYFPDSQKSNSRARTQQKINFSMNLLRSAFSKQKSETTNSEKSTENDILDNLTTKIGKDEDSEAERQLSRSLKKDDFSEMKVIGQFNKGFIICRLRDHLFIVDQHASDEKYNFEKFQKSAKLTKQPLFTPTPLCFGSVQEMIIRENLSIFQANGFDFDFREQNGCLKTFLIARPEILNQQLTNNDLEEILAVVSEYPSQMYRPVRIRNIFASKACRKSVMIGKPLDYKEMTKIVKHLAKLDQPWNCPHGRPTIRHLASLNR